MAIQTFTEGDDVFVVTAAGDYRLAFLGGEDSLTVNGGTSTVATMGDGEDYADLRSGPATIFGDAGEDRFDIRTSNVNIDGGSDRDLFNIRAGSDLILLGGSGSDRFNFIAGVTAVFLDGGEGNDDFLGRGLAIDGEIHGGQGVDEFIGFVGTGVTLFGGEGDDLFRVDSANPATFVEFANEGFDAVQVSRGISFVLPDNIEKISVGDFDGSTLAAATLTGNASDNLIIANNNDDTINGLGGDDNIFGKGGADTLNGGDGDDRLDGGSGNDSLFGEAGNDILNGRAGDDTMDGGAGDDVYYVDSLGDTVVETGAGETDTVRVAVSNFVLPSNVEIGIVSSDLGLRLDGNALDNILTGGSGGDSLFGGDGNDLIKGAAGDDQLFGMIGDDRLEGGDGNDSLDGQEGDDLLYGNDGNDTLAAGAGADLLTGGDDADTFVFTTVSDSTPEATDRIRDFESGQDTFDLSGIDADTTVAGDQAFTLSFTNAPSNTPADLWFTSVADGSGDFNMIFFGDVDGDGIADLQVRLHSIGAFAPADIVL